MRGIGRAILIILVVVIAVGAAGYFFFLPKDYRTTREITVARPVEQVYAYIAATPPGQPLVDGVTVTQITSDDPTARVVTANVQYEGGDEGTARITVAPAEGGSLVTVALDRPVGANPVDRVTALFNNELEPVAEATSVSLTDTLNGLSDHPITGLAYEIVQIEGRPFYYNQNCGPNDPAAIKQAVTISLRTLRTAMAEHRLTIAGPPIAVETEWNEAENRYCYQIGYPFSGTPPRQTVIGTVGTTPAGQAMRVHYTGTEEDVIPVYDQMEALEQVARLEFGQSFEIYYDDPNQTTGSINRDIYYIITSGDASRLVQVAPSSAPVPPPEFSVQAAAPASSEAPTGEAPATPPADGAPAAPPATPPAQ